MIHYEPWFTCDQCGRIIHIGPEGLKEGKHFCDANCKEIYDRKEKMLAIQQAFTNLS